MLNSEILLNICSSKNKKRNVTHKNNKGLILSMLSNWKSCVLQLREQYGECNCPKSNDQINSTCLCDSNVESSNQNFWIFFFKNNSELEQLQNEKRKALLEHETAKLRECDDALQRELRDWKSQLHPRKQVFSMAFTHITYCSFSGSFPLKKLV